MDFFQLLCESGIFLNLTSGYLKKGDDDNDTDKQILMNAESLENPLTFPERVILGVLASVILLFSFLGNIFTFLTIRNRKYQILYKSCLISQSVSDLLFAIFVGIDSLNHFISDNVYWRFGEFMCGWIPYITTACAVASSMILTCIAFDRYQGIVLLRGKWDPKLSVSLFTIIVIWLAAGGTCNYSTRTNVPETFVALWMVAIGTYCVFSIAVPSFLGYEIQEVCALDYVQYTSTYTHLCHAKNNRNNNYFTTVYTLIFLPLLAGFIGLYSLIATFIYNHRKTMSKHEKSISTSETNLETITSQGAKKNIEKQATKEGKKVKTFKIIMIIMFTFLICRLPQWTFIVVTSYPDIHLNNSVSYLVKYVLSVLSLSNTAINPFVYGLLSQVLALKQSISSGFKNWRRIRFFKKPSRTYTVQE